ncbi:hypothetical protein QVD17_37642 [Tagetes erecta]|uniref:Uncharacterized protein n=1 Tax=Tagetes erecta TaxID=13708 RepID=A0AAD8JWF3_TARER|nr:hypothetical protein QVD17_37642 [Tagetes erecta]
MFVSSSFSSIHPVDPSLATLSHTDSSLLNRRYHVQSLLYAAGGFTDNLDLFSSITLKNEGGGRKNWVISIGQMDYKTWLAFVFVPKDNWFVAKTMGTVDPGIEILDLDIIDKAESTLMLGGFADKKKEEWKEGQGMNKPDMGVELVQTIRLQLDGQ